MYDPSLYCNSMIHGPQHSTVYAMDIHWIGTYVLKFVNITLAYASIAKISKWK